MQHNMAYVQPAYVSVLYINILLCFTKNKLHIHKDTHFDRYCCFSSVSYNIIYCYTNNIHFNQQLKT